MRIPMSLFKKVLKSFKSSKLYHSQPPKRSQVGAFCFGITFGITKRADGIKADGRMGIEIFDGIANILTAC